MQYLQSGSPGRPVEFPRLSGSYLSTEHADSSLPGHSLNICYLLKKSYRKSQYCIVGYQLAHLDSSPMVLWFLVLMFLMI